MFNNIDAFHSYDPVEILKALYRLVFGCSRNMNDIGCQAHEKMAVFFHNIIFYLINFYSKYVVFSVFLSMGLIVLIIVYIKKEKDIKQKIMSRVLPVADETKSSLVQPIFENPKWKLVEEHINSDDANKWKLAILEADIMLSELLDTLNLPGDSVGEKLKSVETSDFDHIEEAWEAHKIRNAIAHQGSDFLLTQREAKRVVKLFESVFKEFEII